MNAEMIRQYDNPTTAGFRATLDRLPDEIALAIGLHLFDDDTLSSPCTCVCGWALRETIAREANRDPDAVQHIEWFYEGTSASCARRFGGTELEWSEIFVGVMDDYGAVATAPLIEEALFDRVMAASDNLTPKRATRKANAKN